MTQRSSALGAALVAAFGTAPVAVAAVMPAAAQATSGFTVVQDDWELVCDNTRTCRAAGYHPFGGTSRVSVLLVRAGGPRTTVTGHVRLGESDDEADTAAAWPARLALRIGERHIGTITLRANGATDLPGPLVSALVAALARREGDAAEVTWVSADASPRPPWRLSSRGAIEVLAAMDAHQGRIGTPGALVAPGTRDERLVPPARPAPILVAARVPITTTADRALGRRKPAAMLRAMRDAMRDAMRQRGADVGRCEDLDDPDQRDVAWDVWRLSATRLAVTTPCWLAAYNAGSGLWVVTDRPPYRATFVTNGATEWKGPEAWSEQRGRGVGDCLSRTQWMWDGRRFVLARDETTGLCREVAAGGTWSLPTWVTRDER